MAPPPLAIVAGGGTGAEGIEQRGGGGKWNQPTH